MDDDQQFCLRWNNHQSTLISVFDTLLENETLVDCTLAAEGKFLKAHKVVLSACSPYFATLLQEQYDKHPIFILKDVKYQELRAMMDYMYRGEVNISQDQLAALLKAAESLQIKGLSDSRSGAPKPEHHRGLNVPGSSGSGKLSAGYTLEQTQSKRARIGPSSMESQDMSGSREGSSSPSRRRRKVRRRSIENAMADVHDNSNSSQIQSNQPSLLQQQQQQQSNASLAGVGAITAAASALASQLPVSAATLPTGSSGVAAAAAAAAIASTQGTTTSVTKKTESVKGTSDAMNTENVQSGSAIGADDQSMEHVKGDKQNHKQKSTSAAGKEQAELVIEPKSEYDEEGNEETVEDLTLDDEEMGMEDLDQNAGTSQGGEGSSQGYAPWQHDRSQDELLLATQEAQQRDPQDLSRKLAQLHKENTAPLGALIQKSCQRSILNTTNNTKRARSRNSLQSDAITQSKSLSQQQQQEQPQLQQQQQQQQITTASTANQLNGNRKRMSMSDVSDMLFELYRAKAPKNQQEVLDKFGQTSPVSAETHEPSSTAAIATSSAAAVAAACVTAAASKNLQGDEMVSIPVATNVGNNSNGNNDNNSNGNAMATANAGTSFHPRIKYITKQLITEGGQVAVGTEVKPEPTLTAIPTSVVVMPTSPQIDVKPIINPATGLVISASTSSSAASVIKSVPAAVAAMPGGSNVVPPAAAIAAALLRDGYHTFQQQLHAQELLKQQSRVQLNTGDVADASNATSSKLLENFLRQQREQRNVEGNDTASDTNDGDDEDDSRYNGFEDIHLVEGSKNNLFQAGPSTSSPASFTATGAAASEYLSDESQKYMIAAQAQVLRNFEFSLGDYGGGVGHGGSARSTGVGGHTSPNGGTDGEPVYECCHCGKKYRWKSTLRRHENVECGGKEPSHQCPYCPYKSKQRGNLGVHVRKHHSNLPQLASKRRSKYSRKLESANSSINTSDDSSSKLIIDCSK